MHQYFLQQTLLQAKKRRGFCAPNPAVGAVVVKNGQIIAAANHFTAGSAHAEVNALADLDGEICKGATLYVSLEPCNHYGKTPPCTEAIINAGIACVVYGYKDPNPLVVKANTANYLNKKGVDCIYYPIDEIAVFYQSYVYWLKEKKPFVTAKVAQSLDGRCAYENGLPANITEEALRQLTHQHRLESDVILTTANTILNDEPFFNVRLSQTAIKKKVAIIDSHCRIKVNNTFFSSAEKVIIFHNKKIAVPVENRKKAQYYAVDGFANGHIDLSQVIALLGEKGFHDVWVEAGGRCFSSLLNQNLLQRAIIYIAPFYLGDNSVLSYVGDENRLQQVTKRTWRCVEDEVVLTLDFI